MALWAPANVPVGFCQFGCGKPVKEGNACCDSHKTTDNRVILQDANNGKGCVLFIGATDPQGYGVFADPITKKQRQRAHGVAYKNQNGLTELPPEMELHHDCKTKACIVPGKDHVVLLTKEEHRARHRNDPRVRHSKAVIDEVIRRLKNRESQRSISKSLCVHHNRVARLRRKLFGS